jgi:hypothetical protein
MLASSGGHRLPPRSDIANPNRLQRSNRQSAENGLALANAMYCVVTAGCLLYFRARLAMGDWIYFVGEIVVVGALVVLELHVAAAATATGLAVTAPRAEGRHP